MRRKLTDEEFAAIRWRTETAMRERFRRLYARKRVSRAVRLGRLVRQPCEVCGLSQAEGHHDDYDKPLQVRWLCAEHHRQHHREVSYPLVPR